MEQRHILPAGVSNAVFFMKTILRTEKNRNNPYVMLDRRIFENPDLSWKAKGLLGYLLSKPNDWKIVIKDLLNRSTDGKDSVYSTLKELKKAGYIEEKEIRDSRGKFQGKEYIVREIPDNGNPDPGNPDPDNPTLLINEGTNKGSKVESGYLHEDITCQIHAGD